MNEKSHYIEEQPFGGSAGPDTDSDWRSNILAESPVFILRDVPDSTLQKLRELADQHGYQKYEVRDVLICSETGNSDQLVQQIFVLILTALTSLNKGDDFPKVVSRHFYRFGLQIVSDSGIQVMQLGKFPVNTRTHAGTVEENAIMLLKRKGITEEDYQRGKRLLWEQVNQLLKIFNMDPLPPL